MKILKNEPKNHYTCISCGKGFVSEKERYCDGITNPMCSSICEFKWFYHSLKKLGLNKKNGIFLMKLIKKGQKIEKEDDFSENDLFFETTKYFIKSLLPNVKSLIKLKMLEGQGTETGKSGQKVGNQIGTKTGTRPPLRGVCPLSLSLHFEKNNLSPYYDYSEVTKKLKKWF